MATPYAVWAKTNPFLPGFTFNTELLGLQVAGDRVIIFIERYLGSSSSITAPAAWAHLVSFDNGLNGGIAIYYYDCVGGSTENTTSWTFGGDTGQTYLYLLRGVSLTAPPVYTTATLTTTSAAVGDGHLQFMTYAHPTGSALTAVGGELPLAAVLLYCSDSPSVAPHAEVYSMRQVTGVSAPWIVNDGSSTGNPDGSGNYVGWAKTNSLDGHLGENGDGLSGTDASDFSIFDTVGGTEWSSPSTPPPTAPILATVGQTIALDFQWPTDEVISHVYHWTVITLLNTAIPSGPPPGNNPFVAIDAVGGGTEYVRASQPVGQRGLVQTTFTVPAGVTHVVARMDTNGCTIASPILQFAQIKLEMGSPASSYMPGPNATTDGGVAVQRFTAGTTTYL